MKTKKKISLKELHKYVRNRLGYSSILNTSIYELVCRALDKEGKPKPVGYSYKKWVNTNASFLLEECLKVSHKNWQASQPKIEKVDMSVTKDQFLKTYEWRRVRMIALKKYGAKCQCCGATPATGAVMNVDHIKPRKLFPQLALDPDNLQILCNDCNHGKGNWDITDWRDPLTLGDTMSKQNVTIRKDKTIKKYNG